MILGGTETEVAISLFYLYTITAVYTRTGFKLALFFYLLEEIISLEIEASDNDRFSQAHKNKQVKKPDFHSRQ